MCTVCQVVYGHPEPAGEPGEPGEDGVEGKNHT